MKKILSLILALCMLCGAVALADGISNVTENNGTATMTVNLEVQGGYTVTIPSTIDIDSNPVAADVVEGEQHYKFMGNSYVAVQGGMMTGNSLHITVSSESYDEGQERFKLTGEINGANVIKYMISCDVDADTSAGFKDAEYEFAKADGHTMKIQKGMSGTFVLEFVTDSSTLSGFAADTYTDTLTFTVSENEETLENTEG